MEIIGTGKKVGKVNPEFLSVIQNSDEIWSATMKMSETHIWVSPTRGNREKIPSFLIDRATGHNSSVDMNTKDKSKGAAVA